MNEKRGQITLFIVLGILLVVAVVLIIIYEENITLSQILPERLFPAKTGASEARTLTTQFADIV